MTSTDEKAQASVGCDVPSWSHLANRRHSEEGLDLLFCPVPERSTNTAPTSLLLRVASTISLHIGANRPHGQATIPPPLATTIEIGVCILHVGSGKGKEGRGGRAREKDASP